MPFLESWKSSDKYFRGYGYSENVEEQTNCVKNAAAEGLKWGFGGLAGAGAVVFGASKVWPRFDKSLSVSSRTGLIVMPFFGLFFLMGELTLNDCSKRKKMLRLAMQQQAMQKPSAAQ